MATTPTVPTSAPSTPAPSSAPAATSTPASTPSTPATPSTPVAAPQESQSLEQRLAAKIAPGFQPKPEGDTPAVEAAAPAIEDAAPGIPAELETTQEQPAAETQPADGEENPFDFESYDPQGPKALSEKIASNPALKAALDADPELRGQIFSDARLAARERKYAELFGSPDEAKTVAESHQTFANLRNLMGSVKPGDPQSTQSVITSMLELGALRDENGEILRDPQTGQMRTDGTLGRFLNNAMQMRLNMLEQQATQQGDNETLAALDTIMERAGFRTPSSADEDGLSEELKSERARIAQERQQLEQDKTQRQQEAQKQHDNAIFSKIDTSLDKSIGSILERATGLNDFTRTTVEGKLRSALKQAIGKNSAYQTELDRIERMPLGPNREQKHVALASRFINDHLLSIARPVLAEAGITLQKQAAAQSQSQAARAEAARSEIRGSSAPAQQPKPQNAAEQNAQIRADLAKTLGREPLLEEVIAAKIKAGNRPRTVAA